MGSLALLAVVARVNIYGDEKMACHEKKQAGDITFSTF